MEKKLIVTASLFIKAPASQVWDALTQSHLVKQYMFNCRVVSDWLPGSSIEYIDDNNTIQVKGQIINIGEDKLLQFTCFGPTSGLQDKPFNYTIVTYKLAPDTGGTKVTVTQGDFALVEDGEKRYAECIGGWDFALAGLKKVTEQSDQA